MKFKHEKYGLNWQVIRVPDDWRMAMCQDEDDAKQIAYALNVLDVLKKNMEILKYD
ncbi:hypothetical protein UFOVP581_41 [uncultured Caudovirales phage]|uniref:Uncharacterized protein n=1 Tax=uncultured Caudovirales phage TaxID=2100421 RepID=A0A6J5PD00_9CAUD|nr:hypothetical protein UFOVP581_41 [uncultured Caudovirales phage]